MIGAWITSFFVLAGSLFVLVAALGVIRLPDVLCRMHAATKAGAFGVGLLLVGLVVHSGDFATAVKAGLVLACFYLTAPIAGHLLGRIAYRRERERLNLETDEWQPAVDQKSNATPDLQ
jgi:multicomponent Na+:H+ antiporter subunit G